MKNVYELALIGLAHITHLGAADESQQRAEDEERAVLVAEADEHQADANEPEGASDEAGHGSGLDRGQLGPVLPPVMRTELLARHLSIEMRLQRPAVVRRKRLQIVGPWPDIAPVDVPQDASNLRVVIACKLEHLEIGGDRFHRVSLITLDLYVKPV